jgi:flagellar hook-basal body complex protein FliE
MTKILPGYARQVVPNFTSLVNKTEKDEKVASFPEVLKEMVNNTNDLQAQAADIAEKFALGEVTEIHEVMVAAEEAGIALELVMEIRNKLVEAYQEMMRLSV